MTGSERPHESPHGPILLLAGQAFALGLSVAWITIPATAIFLAAYGSELLPATYIGAAVAGVVSSTLLAAAFRRRPLASVAIRTLAGLSASLVASWAVLASWGADWVSFALLMLVPIMVPVGFIFVVGQAGMLLDVRILKVLYARVVAGFALGFVVGGLAGPLLLALLGPTESLLAAAAAATGLFFALVAVTRRRYPAELSVIERAEVEVGGGSGRPTLRALSRNRYVMLIVAFQMLSAVESQWLDFHMLASAAQRYSTSNELARFISQFSAIAYGTDIVFLVVLAGVLLHRFGLRYGLTANAVGVLTLVGAVIAATAFLGSGATIVFGLIVAARVTDLTLSDGTSRTSLSAAYQAVPARMRSLAQATVEGLAVPVAIGASGVVLLVVQSASPNDGLVLPVLTGLVVLAWTVVAVLVYRDYRVNLLANLRGRTLDPADLTVESESSLLAIDRLVESEDERDVRLGLDILTIAQHPGLPERLQRLVGDVREGVRRDALERLVQVAPDMAERAARGDLDHPSPHVRAASIRVLAAARNPSDVVAITQRSADPAPEVRVAVAFALTRIGDDAVRTEVATEIARLVASASADDRTVAALMLGDVEPGEWLDRNALRVLLADLDHNVVNAALAALRWPEDTDRFAEVTSHLVHRRTARASVDALVRAGDAALFVIDDGLRGNQFDGQVQQLLVRAGREIGGPSAIAMLRRHIDHPDREVGLAIMTALAALGPSRVDPQADPSVASGSLADDGARDAGETAVVADDLEHATHILRALVTFEDEPAAALQRSALRDELDLVRQRVLAALSMRHGTEGLNRVVFQLAQRDPRSHSLALEWLDVTLTGTDHAVVAVLEPRLSDRERMNALMRRFPIPPLTPREVLIDLVQDPDSRWRRPWITACALYTASGMSEEELDVMTTAAERWTASGADDDESIVHETLTGIRHRRLDPV